MSERITGFAPIVFDDSEVLLLGTLPGAMSLQREFYFADESNYFWDFFSEYTGLKKPQNKEDVSLILKKSKVALWDIYESAVRVNSEDKSTSNDSDIEQAILNDLELFLNTYPNIKRIGIMGKKAYTDFTKKYPNIKAEYLPSTSGSNGAQWGGKPINKERIGWKKFKAFIEGENI